MTIPAHAFISYSRKDTAFVDRLERDLRLQGIVTWRDIHSIPGGAQWFRRIKAGLDSSYAMLYIDTANAEFSDWVEREFLYAAALKLPIIPVKPDEQFVSMATINLNPIICDEARYVVGVGKIVAVLGTLPQIAITPGATPPPAAATTPEPSIPLDLDDEAVTGEIRDYLGWLLIKTQADLRDALYVDLVASPEKRAETPIVSAPSPFGDFDLDFDMSLDRLPLEHVRGEAFDQRGDEVQDARVPVRDLKRVILLGEPGAGKTTTLAQLAVDLARAAQAAPEIARIPVFIPLRQFNGETDFPTFVYKQTYNLGQAAFEALLKDGRVVLLLDALNEMPRKTPDGRDLVAEVQDYLRDKPEWVVSCRVRDYQEDLRDLQDAAKVRLKPLDPPRIYAMIHKKFAEQYARDPRLKVSAEDGEALWRAMHGSAALLKAWETFVACERAEAFWGRSWPVNVKPTGSGDWRNTPSYFDWQQMRSDRRRMLPLCRNPYITKLVCDLYAIDKALPDNRGGLFNKLVDKLLERDRKAAMAVGAKWLPDEVIRDGLARIAFAMGGGTELAVNEVERILIELGDEVSLLLRLATGASLIEVGEAVRFTHQLLQEYFASEVLGALVDAKTDPQTLWPPENWWQPTGREETAIILAGVRGDPESVARWIAPAQPELAVELLTQPDFGLDLNALDDSTRTAILTSAHAKTAESDPIPRAAAYRVLGLLNADDRLGIGIIPLSSVGTRHASSAVFIPDLDWVEIPGGEFQYGHESEKNNPPKLLTLPTFHIARYPITYAQFQCFVDAPDYDDDRWWLDMPDEQEVYGRTYRTRELSDQAFKFNNHPRERVAWYQAVAFCRWLSDKMGYLVTLPTEEQWEKAARGTDGREYPYQGEFDAAKGNTRETGIGQTSAVGLFPAGASPYGILDLFGNMWELCLNKYETPAEVRIDASGDWRVVRGGSWLFDQDDARAVFRFDYHPSYRSYGIGFRVCRPPSL